MGLFDIFKSKPQAPVPVQKNPYSDDYFKDMEKIESAWSVLQNLKVFYGEQADSFETLCRKNAQDYHRMTEYDKSIDPNCVIPKHAPAFVRLAMLYEKREDYEQAITVCVEAIQCGAYDDGSKGKMYGRLARLIRKSGIDVNPEILKLAEIK